MTLFVIQQTEERKNLDKTRQYIHVNVYEIPCFALNDN